VRAQDLLLIQPQRHSGDRGSELNGPVREGPKCDQRAGPALRHATVIFADLLTPARRDVYLDEMRDARSIAEFFGVRGRASPHGSKNLEQAAAAAAVRIGRLLSPVEAVRRRAC
jgi:hypothetical protein